MKRAAIRVIIRMLSVVEEQLDELSYGDAAMPEGVEAKKLVKQARSQLVDFHERSR